VGGETKEGEVKKAPG